ncbi:hypothetical protein AKJ41_03260 [candidate division MSBL1 archaeon SCGC-AAA259O05]|uniref:Solute-binding protein family 5 domain-containing protein n=1 Tax=candidate division MSBL1 archaeon SCGC-AAA259O05 TaxID=1698271 RepID=A0A133V3F8_9EURY|nr:hypothetical protein AKJ41_03260 [candidate division MSBL1 archaeon SCGC-AAA259O05]
MNGKSLISAGIVSVLLVGFLMPLAGAQRKLKPETAWSDFSGSTWPKTWNPIYAEATGNPVGIRSVYEPLAALGTWKGELYPMLAENWGFTDKYTFEINIYPEAEFHDGSPVTAEDVKFSLNAHGNKKWGGTLSTLWDSVESVSVVDETTLHINLKENYPNYQMIKDCMLVAIFSKDRWQPLIEEYGENIVDYPNLDLGKQNGSGPYKLSSFSMDKIVLKRVSDYWGNKIGHYFLPEYHGVMKEVESTARFNDFKQHNIDVVTGWVPASMDYTDQRPSKFGWWNEDAEKRVEKYAASPLGQSVLAPNLEKLDMVRNNLWLRKALTYALDVSEISEKSHLGCGAAGPPSFMNPLLPKVPEYTNKEVIRNNFETTTAMGVPVIKYDPEKAVEILKEHCEGSVDKGWTYNGEKIGGWTLETVQGWVDWMGTLSQIKEMWSKIGINVETKFHEYGTWSSRYMTKKFDWSMMGIGGPEAPYVPLNGFNALFLPHTSTWVGSKFNIHDVYPEKGQKAQNMLNELYSLPIGSEESIRKAKKLQELYVPELYMIPLWTYVRHGQWWTNRWANWPTKDDPYDMQYALQSLGSDLRFLDHMYPVSVETASFSLSKGTVNPGEVVTASVTLNNTGDADHNYAVKLRKGPAKAGPGPEVIAHKATVVPAGGSKTVELEFSIDETGSHTITVDDWRFGKTDSNPGDPIEKTLIVKKKEEEIGPPIPENLPEKVDMAIKTAQDAKDAALSAKDTAQDAKNAAQEAVSAANAAKESADDAKAAAEEAGGVSASMLVASMVITIIVVLAGVYVITGKRAT